MALGVRVEPELEKRHGDGEEARRQSQYLAQLEQPHWSEQLPNWIDWIA